jgi:N-acetylglucosaminyl-diphospho-decaprenol L-rhamnosyltransferase
MFKAMRLESLVSKPVSSVGSREGVCVSIVSHKHGAMVTRLVQQLEQYSLVSRIILTYNANESNSLSSAGKLTVISNTAIKGFGANHNTAFSHCDENFFCVLNPDLIFTNDPFQNLIDDVSKYSLDIISPTILDVDGMKSESARDFPTLRSLAARFASNHRRTDFAQRSIGNHENPYWVGGMFMLFRSEAFEELGGFDEGYFLYVEDVDICQRAIVKGMSIFVSDTCSVIHDARRASRRDIGHLLLHLRSYLRYFLLRLLRSFG